MIKHAKPRTNEQAIALLERFSALNGKLALVEAARAAAIGDANKVADAASQPLVTEIEAITGLIKPWWAKAGPDLVKKGQKSAELGGCMIGTKVAPASLTFSKGDDKAAVKALLGEKWAKPYLRVSVSVAKPATLAALDGKKHGTQLTELGFGKSEPGDVFFLKPVAQSGVVAPQ